MHRYYFFINQICNTKKDQKETFYDIKIDTDRSIASISFDYSFHSGDKMVQSDAINNIPGLAEKRTEFICNIESC